MSTAHATVPKTPTAPARAPSGFPFAFYRYRNYTIFAFTSIPMAISLVSGRRPVPPNRFPTTPPAADQATR